MPRLYDQATEPDPESPGDDPETVEWPEPQPDPDEEPDEPWAKEDDEDDDA